MELEVEFPTASVARQALVLRESWSFPRNPLQCIPHVTQRGLQGGASCAAFHSLELQWGFVPRRKTSLGSNDWMTIGFRVVPMNLLTL